MSPEFNQANYPNEGDGRRTVLEVKWPGSLLSKEQIVKHVEEGNIVVRPFIKENVGGASVDVRLGKWFWREKDFVSEGIFGQAINLWDDDAAKKLWLGPFKAPTVENFFEDFYDGEDQTRPSLEGANVELSDQIIILQPGENILTHTQEFIGGNQKIGTAMQARSSMGRSHVTVCRCAGWGDPGYINRWTMEVTNNSQHHPIVLVAGRRVAQIVFWEIEPVSENYGKEGKYQAGTNIDEIMERWHPIDMLPRLYLDREVRKMGRVLGDRLDGESGSHYAIRSGPRTDMPRRYGQEIRKVVNLFEWWGLLPREVKRVKKSLASGGWTGLLEGGIF